MTLELAMLAASATTLMKVVSSAASGGVTTTALEILADRITSAKKDFSARAQDADGQTGNRRGVLLKRLAQCQTRIVTEVYDARLMARLAPFALEQTATLYEARSEADFAALEISIGQVESILEKNRQAKAAREWHRMLAVWFTLVFVLIIALLVSFSSRLSLSAESVIPVLQIPAPIVLWSAIGSLGAMLYRFNNFADAELADPLRWLFTRPLTGVLMGVITYMSFKIGVLVLQSGDAGAAAGAKSAALPAELLWLAAFLAGFSDRFADTVLKTLTGRLGGDRNAELVTIEQPTASAQAATMGALIEKFGMGTRRRVEAPNRSPNTIPDAHEAGRPGAANPTPEASKAVLAFPEPGAKDKA